MFKYFDKNFFESVAVFVGIIFISLFVGFVVHSYAVFLSESPTGQGSVPISNIFNP